MIVTGACMATVVLGGAERLRWTIAEIPYLDIPSSSHVVATAMSNNGAVTGRSGSTLSSVGWHAFVWTPTEGMQQCADDGWALSLGQAINDAHTVAGSVNTCPSDNGPCSTAPAILQLDDEAQLIGPLLQEYAYVQGITEAGHVVYEQSTGELWESGGWVNMPSGDSIALPMPDEAWSVDLGKPVFLDNDPHKLLIPGYAWMSPARQPMIWTVDVSNSTVSATVLTGISGGEAHVILENGTVLGMLYIDGASVPVEWPYPWTTWSPLTEVDSNIYWDAAMLGNNDGLYAGAASIAGLQVTWIHEPSGNLTILDSESLGLPPSDIEPVTFLPDGSLLLDVLDRTFYTSTAGSWRSDTGYASLIDRAFETEPLESPGSGEVIAGAVDGSFVINRYPNAWGAIALSPGDVNGDGIVTVDDLLSIIAAWGKCGESCLEDLDASGDIGVDDLLAVLSALAG